MNTSRKRKPEPLRTRSPLAALWRLFFAVGYRRPVSWAERHQLRMRATVFFVAGVAATLLVQAALGRYGLCSK